MEKYVKSALIIAVTISSFMVRAVQTMPSASAQGRSFFHPPSCEAARQEHTPLDTPAYDAPIAPEQNQCAQTPSPHADRHCVWDSSDPEEQTKAFLNRSCAKETPPSP